MARRKFNDNDIREIRASENSARSVAKQYGVSFPTILAIRHHQTYKWVPAIVDDPSTSPIIRDNQFLRIKAMKLMNIMPDGYCQTVVTSIPHELRRPWEPTERTEQIYANWKQKVLDECLRVAGPQGIFICHQLQVDPDEPSETDNYLTILRGTESPTPEESTVAEIASIISEIQKGPAPDPQHPPSFPEELTDACLSLGTGRVLDPFGNTGAIPLAAIRAGRTWLACDMRTDLISTFKRRLAQITQVS